MAKQKRYYYEIYIKYECNEGYSVFFWTKKPIRSSPSVSKGEAIVAHALASNEITTGEENWFDYAQKITKAEYTRAMKA